MSLSSTTTTNIKEKFPINILIFDVETTGLIKKNKEVNDQPYILQLSFIVIKKNKKTTKITKIYNKYVKVENDVYIHPEITAINGITKEICSEKGEKIEKIIRDLYCAYKKCHYVVSHNLYFDTKMVLFEIQRNSELLKTIDPNSLMMFNCESEIDNRIMKYCTMLNGRQSILTNPQKFPKLVELYQILFQKTPLDLHNSLIDTFVCFCCFLKMKFDEAIDKTTQRKLFANGFKLDDTISKETF